VDRRLRAALSRHQVLTVAELGWDRLRNGALLATAAENFDAFVTVDQNFQYQQNIAALPISVVILAARSSKLSDLLLLVPALEKALDNLAPNSLVVVTEG